MNSMIENILANAWVILLIFKNSICDRLSYNCDRLGDSNLMIQYMIGLLILGSMIYATYLYKKRWNELKINRPDLFMLIEERKKAMQESKGKK